TWCVARKVTTSGAPSARVRNDYRTRRHKKGSGMKLTQLLEGLSNPSAYPYPVRDVEVRQTHISVVFLAGPYASKVKKPLDLGFRDFSPLAKRRHFCEEEVRLNRRLAPAVYQGVVPVTRAATGLQVEGPGEAVEWVVKMERLPAEATLQKRLLRGEVG